jgi:hypothetical protein
MIMKIQAVLIVKHANDNTMQHDAHFEFRCKINHSPKLWARRLDTLQVIEVK